jgi:Transglutaminase-like superfamily
MHAWKRFRRLAGADRRIVMAAAAALTTTWLALRLAGFRRSAALLERFAPAGTTSLRAADSNRFPQEIARLTRSTARSLPFACNCLDRSLALCWMLRRRGIPAQLRMGARKDGTQLKAHAWVESDGTALNDPEAEHEHFVPFDGAVIPLETGTP